MYQFIDSLHLCNEGRVAQRARRFIVHDMVAQLIFIKNKTFQYVFATGNLRSNDKKGRFCTILLENFHDLVRVLRRRIVDGEGNEFGLGRDLEQNIRPSSLEIADEKGRRFVDPVEGCNEDTYDPKKNEHRC